MEAKTNFSFYLKNNETENLYHYLKNTVGWLCLNINSCLKTCPTKCLAHRIWWDFEKIYHSTWMTKLERKFFLRLMFKKLIGEPEFDYFCKIFKDQKGMKQH